MSGVTYMEPVELPVATSVASILDSICPKPVPLTIVTMPRRVFRTRSFIPGFTPRFTP